MQTTIAMADATAIRTRWADAFNAGDIDKLTALYTRQAHFYGSTPALFKGRDGVRTYFSQLPPGATARMKEHSAIHAAPDVLLSAGLVDFVTKDGSVFPFRLTLALLRVEGQWQIAQHHGSPLPKG